MAVAVLTDAHLGGPGGDLADGAQTFLEQLRALPGQGCERLVLLGDIFHVWVGYPRFETAEIAAVVPELRALRRAGVRVEYIEGNRDFYLADGAYADAFDAVMHEAPIAAGGRHLLAVHGDGLNDRDRQYLFWRWLSKSAGIRLLVRNLPRALAHRLLHGTEKKLAQTNFKHRTEIPEEAIRRYGERRLAEGFDELILGHFHEPRTWEVAGGTVRLLEAWFTSRRVEWF
jgi:UDP-2,3-diacylglucosamine hydrolase